MPVEKKYQYLHHFVPDPDQKVRAKLLSVKAFVFYTSFAALFYLFMQLILIFLPGTLGYASNIVAQDLLDQTNEVRKSHGLHPLKLNRALSSAAEKKAAHMFSNDYWAHVSPMGNTPWEFILAQNYDYLYAGENLAKNFNTSKQVVDAWYKSPSHKENLLNENYQEIGFGVVNGVLGGYQTTLVVQMFGTPRDSGYLASAELSEAPPVPNNLPEFVIGPAEQNVIVSVDITSVARYLLGFFVVFLVLLLVLDVWYSHRKSAFKISGQSLAHILFLVLILGGVWVSISPGKII